MHGNDFSIHSDVIERDTQHNDIQRNDSVVMLSVVMLNVVMLNVQNKPFMPNVVMLSVLNLYAECHFAERRGAIADTYTTNWIYLNTIKMIKSTTLTQNIRLKFEKFKFSEHSLQGRPQALGLGGGQVTLKYLIISLKKKICRKERKN